jgi:DNA-directed RNA polymerase subunit E'
LSAYFPFTDIPKVLAILDPSGLTIRTTPCQSGVRSEDLHTGKAATMGKIGITCRQPFLGAPDWIKEELKNSNAPEEKENVVEAKEKSKN